MENNIEKILNDFVDDQNDNSNVQNPNSSQQYKNYKKVVMNEREGLIERVDKIYVTNDGRQLLREQY